MTEPIFPKPDSVLSVAKLMAATIAIAISCFHLYTGAFGIIEAYGMRTIHLMTLLTLAFLYWPAHKSWPKEKTALIDLLLAVLCLAIDVYLIIHHERLTTREWYTGPVTFWDVAFGWTTIVLVLEATRRVAGIALPIVALCFVGYTVFGQFLPYPFTIRSPNLLIFIDHMFLTPHAIFGVPVGVSATFVFLFIMFAAFLDKTGAGKFIIDFSMSAVGWATGGPAKVGVIASGIFGTITGHSVANVYGTGTFTIPLMKRMGYRPEYAGAVEAAASAGGQIMPPIMGAAAFIIAEFIGVSYLTVCKAALFPALLYFAAVFASTHLEALKMGLKPLPRSELPPMKATLFHGFHFIIPIFVLIFVLVLGYTPFRAAFLAIIVLLVVAMARKNSRLGPRSFTESLVQGARNGVVIAVCCACAGLVVGSLDITGMGIKFVDIIIMASGGVFPFLLLLIMVASLVLGMGIPTAPAYIIVAMIAAPSLVNMGLEPIVAHMFVFYSCLLSAITPPVALAAYAGAAIAGAPVMRTGVIAAKLGFVKYIVPFVFAYNAALLMEGTPIFVTLSFLTALAGTIGLSATFEKYLFTRLSIMGLLIMLTGSVLLLISNLYTDLAGVTLLTIAVVMNLKDKRALAVKALA
jgi:TRAP transporter 4TM/12TM fusion protein